MPPDEHDDQWPGIGVLLAGRYELLRFIARGAAATLWRARDTQLERDVALKILNRQAIDGPSARERFRREALAIAQVSHPNVVRIFDAVEDGDAAFLVTEFVDGPVLSQFEGQRLQPATVATVGHQIASALGAVHDHGLVHRDVKPANIILDGSTGRAKLLDFGIIKDVRNVTEMTGPRGLVATIRYAAPEQVTGGPVGPFTDTYSLGLVLWEACTGRPAFDGDTAAATAATRLHRDPPPVGDHADAVPARLAEVIHRATQREPTDRYARGSDLAAALRPLTGPLAHELTGALIAPRRADDEGPQT